MTAAAIRQQFLDFFQSKGHLIVSSAPLVVKNDPTLLFINSGMAPFKDAFLGNQPPPAPRVADTQKCLRVSGKHNDLEEVGVDGYHHTLFEMLGNWSFGDYFKKDAIAWSWELLTDVYGIPKDQLYVTVFGGDAQEGLARDEEALELWKQYVPEERILFGSKKDNFWEMGDTGPCGPCTEIHVDTRTPEERADGLGGTLVNADHPQVIEIWNNVFMQFNRLKDGSLQPLPQQHVDTGMGFERLVRVLQQKQSNYDTDVFSGTIAAIEKITNRRYTATDSRPDVAFRVLADHIRAIAFTTADGQLPSNTGAGYVIRRILRRAVRYYYSYLEYKQPMLHQLISLIATQFEAVFPELKKQQDFVARVIREEEEAFLRTLEKGLRRMDDLIGATSSNVIEGAAAFELYDTYGFPIDLTRLIASEKGYAIDEAGFEQSMQVQKTTSKNATKIDAEDWVVLKEGSSRFVGYDSLEAKTEVLRYRKVKAKGRESYQIVLAETPFYAESGGQVGDRGTIWLGNEKIAVVDTKKENDLIIHFADAIPGDLSGEAIAGLDLDRRFNTEKHHSATHLLHAALRMILGDHVAQKGSLVNNEQLRFDFSHFAKMTDEEIAGVEMLVNAQIRANSPVVIQSMSKEDAVARGAMALFGEKYGDTVRVVEMDPNYSIELCGGTHVRYTGELGYFKIKSEGAVAAGVRRIEAVSGKAAEDFVNEQLRDYQAARALLKNPKQLAKSIESLQTEGAGMRKSMESLENKGLAAMAKDLATNAENAHGIAFAHAVVEVSSAEGLRKLGTEVMRLLSADEAAICCLSAVIGGKANVVVGISQTLVDARSLDAGKIIKEVVGPIIKGGGGGSKMLATAGGTDASRVAELADMVRAAVLPA